MPIQGDRAAFWGKDGWSAGGRLEQNASGVIFQPSAILPLVVNAVNAPIIINGWRATRRE